MSWLFRAVKQIFSQNRVSRDIYENVREITSNVINSNRQFYSVATLLQFAVIVGSMEPKKRARTVSKEKYKTTLDSKAQYYLNALKVRWMQLHDVPGLFAYQLQESRPGRRLPGKCGFYAELNADRSLKRRVPQVIDSLNPTFRPKQFNFNKVDAMEVMMTIDEERDNVEVQMIINKSPITKYHTLICPDVKKELVQRITFSSLNFCTTFMRSINDPNIRLGYNSPGALASVNHLHFHLLHIPRTLYIDNVELEPLAGNYVYRLKNSESTEAICFVIGVKDTEEDIRDKVQQIHRLTEWLCNNKLPHNLFMTQDRQTNDLRVFLFVRSTYCVSKDASVFNVGFCELVGFFPLSDEAKLQNLTEPIVIERIKDITGNAYESAYRQTKRIVDGSRSTLWPFLV
ncbi:GDP-D-glucose phosphorylase 1 isoform X2 [Drosophila hydei]|uniref:GDP-D-glucose phosphorylase 1 n=1 Tax=Drosophila hydei TaxID=7224 RepID=A0A6J1MLI0_DROHY|nr:GDP-D-glucose phosphorylase 1 isoform X2 [Drosophila hydei]